KILISTLDDYKGRAQSLIDEVDSLSVANKKLKNLFAKNKTDMVDLKSQLSSLRNKSDALTSSLNLLKKEKTAKTVLAQKKIAILSKNVNKLEEVVASNKAISEKLATNEKKLIESQRMIVFLEKEKNNMQQKNVSLGKKIAQQSKIAAPFKTEIKNMRAQLATFKNERAKLSKEVENLEKDTQDLIVLKEASQELVSNLEAKTKEAKDLKIEREFLQKERDNLFYAKVQRAKEVKAYGSQVYQLRCQRDALTQELNGYKEKQRISNIENSKLTKQQAKKSKKPLAFLEKKGNWKYLILGLLLLPTTLIVRRWLYF
ncbi:MAG: hypothetical protein GY858_10090, partial [Candidatus Omnitrophica bacterium]|nr:hypothetical protein [Candidatus Omnitrophota bacterium]